MLIKKLHLRGFNFKLVLADSLYGESGTNFLPILDKLGLNYLGLAEYIDRTWRSLGYAITPGEGKVQNKQVE